jgi:oxygen-independent coproporphyrinogen-3 oxidase
MNLIRKYNTAAPRYTSYPTVPYWDNDTFSKEIWKESVKNAFDASNQEDGISIYIHLPFCESLCTYCGCNTRITVNHKVEEPYINALLKEWQLYLNLFSEKPRIRQIHLGGGTPTFFTPENLEKLLNGIYKSADICEVKDFGFEAHPNNTTSEHLQTLYDLGFTRLSLGIQDFDPHVQHVVNRIQSYESVDTVTKEARRIGYQSINYDLIYGLPFQTRQSITDTIQKVATLRPDRIAYYSYAHIPWIKPGQRRFTEMDLPADEEKQALYELGKEMLNKAGYIEIGMDHFALKEDSLYVAVENNDLHRNFMGYTTGYSRLMVSLGVSSISDTWDCFAQNVKTVEGYHKLIEEGEIPVFRGHKLNEEDLKVRQHVLNIMCRFKTTFENDPMQDELLQDAIPRLKEMEEDGLCVILPREIRVTDKGKPFVRNICMAFDARLWRNQPQSQLFSNAI